MSGPIGSSQLMYSAGAGDFYSHQIANSCRFNRADVSKMSRALGTPSDTKKFTFSSWVKLSSLSVATNDKRCIFGGSGSTNSLSLGIENGQLIYIDYPSSGGSNNGGVETLVYLKRLSRDVGAWQHIVINNDTTQAVAANRVKFYINGELQTVFDTHSSGGVATPFYPAEDSVTINASSHTFIIGTSDADNEANAWDGYQAETYFIDGTAYAGSDFGETKNGVWIPKNASGLTFGNNGFYLKYTNSSDLGEDFSGNDNDYTVANISAHDQMLDSPTFNSSSNGGNFCTYNPLTAGSYISLSEGNLKTTGTQDGDEGSVLGTMGVTSGKWYWEVRMISMRYSVPGPGISAGSASATQATTTGGPRNLLYYAGNSSNFLRDFDSTIWGTVTEVETGLGGFSAGDKMMICLDVDNKKVWYGKNGSWFNSGNPATGANPQQSWTGTGFSIHPSIQEYDSSSSSSSCANFGADGTFAGTETAQGNADGNGFGDFYYSPPSGFLAICSANLPIAAGVDPAQTDDDYSQKAFDVVTYTGNGQARTISTNFKADNIWVKQYNASRRHYLVTNTINANFGTTSYLHPSNNVSEGNSTDGITASSSTNFTIGGSQDYVNTNTGAYVSYLWRVNGGTTSALNDGDINTTGQINQTHGCGVLLYTGDGGSSNVTMAHGMGKKPEFLWMKDRDSNGNNNNWEAWHHNMADDNYLYFNLDSAQASTANGAIDTSEVSDTLLGFLRTSTTGGSQTRFENGDNFIIYQFVGVEGHSKFGSYEGNGNADGAFVYTGFSPAFVMVKSIDSTSDWEMYDNKRAGYNADNDQLEVGDEAAQDTGTFIDFLSNGFKLRASGDPNVAETYIYGAWAHNSSKYATAR